MKMKFTKLKNKSERGKCIAEILKIKTAIRRKQTGGKCEICGRLSNNSALHHVLERSRCPRLILYDKNLILMCWNCHFSLHHYTANNPRYQAVERGIIKLLGEDYEKKLLIANEVQEKITMNYLKLYLLAIKSGGDNGKE